MSVFTGLISANRLVCDEFVCWSELVIPLASLSASVCRVCVSVCLCAALIAGLFLAVVTVAQSF